MEKIKNSMKNIFRNPLPVIIHMFRHVYCLKLASLASPQRLMWLKSNKRQEINYPNLIRSLKEVDYREKAEEKWLLSASRV